MRTWMRLSGFLFAGLWAVFLGAQSKDAPMPMVDGVANEYAALGAQTLQLEHGVKLYVYQNEDYVWLAFTLSEGSYGTVDMQLATPALEQALNLHISAQLGEWPVAKPELAPQKARSDRWWNQRGWTANTLWFNGLDPAAEQPQAHFKRSSAREIQLAKARFGKGTWYFSLQLNAIRDAAGAFQNIRFPEGDGRYALVVP